MEDVTAQPTVSPTATPEPEQGGAVVRETFSAIVNRDGAYVYRERSTASQRMQVARGRALTVVAYNDEWAQVYNGSAYAFIPRTDIDRVEDVTAQPTVAPTATPEPEQGGDVVRETFTATVTKQGARVYQSASTDAASEELAYGATVTVVAYDDTWAQLAGDGRYGFTQRENLTRGAATATPTPAPTPTPGGGSSFDEAVESGDYSNEELTFLYLTREAGLNTAAACGLLANIKAESSFRPTAYNPNGGSVRHLSVDGRRQDAPAELLRGQWAGLHHAPRSAAIHSSMSCRTITRRSGSTSPPWTTPRTALTTRATTSAITLKCPPTAPAVPPRAARLPATPTGRSTPDKAQMLPRRMGERSGC